MTIAEAQEILTARAEAAKHDEAYGSLMTKQDRVALGVLLQWVQQKNRPRPGLRARGMPALPARVYPFLVGMEVP